jgi:hypothetical protein
VFSRDLAAPHFANCRATFEAFQVPPIQSAHISTLNNAILGSK